MTWAFPVAVIILLSVLTLAAYADRIYFEMGKFLSREYAEKIEAETIVAILASIVGKYLA